MNTMTVDELRAARASGKRPSAPNADLWGANLSDANLWGADLRGADLWGGLRLDGLPSGQVTMVPTRGGWYLRVGCWHGTPDGLRTLIASDEGWPEATGAEVTRRRPSLEALLVMLDAHMVLHADKLAAVAHWAEAA